MPGSPPVPKISSDEIAAAALSVSHVIDAGPFNGFDVGARYAERTKKHRFFSWNQTGSDAPLSAYDGLIPRYALPDLNVPTALNGNLHDLAEVAIGGFDPSLASRGHPGALEGGGGDDGRLPAGDVRRGRRHSAQREMSVRASCT